MPSPFPGMDPFIECQKWRGFHHALISTICDVLVPLVRPRYVVDVEENIYLVNDDLEVVRLFAPDLAVTQGEGWLETHAGSAAFVVEPEVLTLPQVEPIEEGYIVLRSKDSEEVVTVIEVLSPTNMSLAAGRAEYLSKRNSLIRSRVNLIEIDLLRGGSRLPTVEQLPVADYYAYVSRATERPKVAVYAWPLDRQLPPIPVPLAEAEAEVQLDLQSVFNTTYDRAGYDYALKYDQPIEPPLNESQQAWVSDRIRNWRQQ